MHHQSKFNPDVSLIKFSSIWREIRLAIVLPAVKYSLQPICFQVKPIQVRWNQANDNGTMRVKKETRTCSIQLREHNIDDNGSMCVCVCVGTQYTYHKFEFAKSFSVFWYMLAFLNRVFFHFRNVSFNNIGCGHQILLHVQQPDSESQWKRARRRKKGRKKGNREQDVNLFRRCWCIREIYTDFIRYEPWARWTISTIYLTLDHVCYQ